jgi:peptidoglycan/LPS O-acetylase OafA/YrhL
VTIKRPIGIQLLAALLTIYTMAGFLLAVRMVTERDERYRWWMIVVAAAAFAVASGAATLAVWRVERRAPPLLVACGALGSLLCLALPAAVPDGALAPGMWRAAIQGALLILAFLLLAAWYVRNVVRART